MDYRSKRYYKKWAAKSEEVVKAIFKKHNRECDIKTVRNSGTVKIKVPAPRMSRRRFGGGRR